MKVLIVGANGIAEQLVQRIGTGWDISLVDIDQDVLRDFSTDRTVDKVQGDGSSKLVLKKAGLEQAGAVIALTDNDEVKALVSKVASEIKSLKPVEPYKGKGIKEKDQYVIRKEGKKK